MHLFLLLYSAFNLSKVLASVENIPQDPPPGTFGTIRDLANDLNGLEQEVMTDDPDDYQYMLANIRDRLESLEDEFFQTQDVRAELTEGEESTGEQSNDESTVEEATSNFTDEDNDWYDFERMHSENNDELMSYMKEITGKNDCNEYRVFIDDLGKVVEKCGQNVLYLPGFPPEEIRKLSADCVDELMNSTAFLIKDETKFPFGQDDESTQGPQSGCLVTYLKAMLFSLRHIKGESWRPSWIQKWATHRREPFPFIKPSVFRRLSPEDCMTMDVDVLLHTTSRQLDAISPDCFAELRWTQELVGKGKDSLQRAFKRIKPYMLTRMYKPMPGVIAAFLDSHQMRRIPPEQCQYLSFDLLRPYALREASLECLRSHLLERAEDTPPLRWKYLNSQIVSKLLERDEIASRLRHDDWEIIPSYHFEKATGLFLDLCPLWEVPSIMAHIPIPPMHCLSRLNQDLVVDVLKAHKATLPKEYFSMLSAEMVEKFPNGFDTLTDMNLTGHQWSVLGEDISGASHPCTLITEPRQLLSAPILQIHMPKMCLLNISCWSKFTIEQVEKLHHNTIGTMSYEHLETLGIKSMMKGMNSQHMRALCDHSTDFTRRISLEDWRLIPKDALAGVTSACVFNLRILEDLSEEDLQRLPDNAFETIGKDDLHRISHLPQIRPRQLGSLGSKVPLAKSPGLAIRERDFKQLCESRDHLLEMPLQVMGFIPETFCVHIDTPAKFSYLPPASLVLLNSSCLEFLNLGVFAGITASQAMMLSSELPHHTLVDEVESPLRFLVQERDSINYTSIKCLRILLHRLYEASLKDIQGNGSKLEKEAPSESNIFVHVSIVLSVMAVISIMVAILR